MTNGKNYATISLSIAMFKLMFFHFSATAVLIISAYYALLFESTTFDIWTILDRYGFPTAILVITIAFIWNRQKLADAERNGLIQRNNELTQKVIDAIKIDNACKFVDRGKNNVSTIE